jgi:hypothetical protein
MLCSHKEKVGSVFYLLIALHNERGCEIFETPHERQKDKYVTFPNKSAITSMNLATQKTKSGKTKAPTSNAKDDGKTGKDGDSGLPVETDDKDSMEDNDSSDSDSSNDELAEAAKKKKTTKELPASAFPYQKDLLHGSDHQSKHPFDRSDESIVFVCQAR